jgi:RHS repeat-associated protein
MKSAKEIRIKSPVNHSPLQSCITLLMLCMTLMLASPGHAQLLVPGQPDPINLTFLGDNSSLYVCTKGGTGTKSSDTAIGTTSKGKKSGTVSAASTNLSTVSSTSCVLPPQDSLTLTTENDLPNAITSFGNDASFINLSMPLNMVAGQSYDVAVSMKNSGNTTWQPGIWKLGSQAPQDNTTWGPNRVQLAAPVGPGSSVAFSFVVRAPTTPGIYTYKWQMVQEYIEFFGAPTTEYQISVTAPPPPTPAPTLTVTRNPTMMVANQSFTLNWSTTNATSLTRVCTSTGTGFVANGTLATSGSAPGTASSAWVGFPSTCTWTATGVGGRKQVIETMTTNAAAPPPPPSGPTVTYIHTDGLGSPVARTNEQGELISRTRYEPYGATAGGATPGIGFTGHVNDPETGLTYMQQRYYDPLAGRFLSVDPVLTDANTGASFNRYVYANNNPYRYIDPDGRDSESPYCLTGGGCYGHSGSSGSGSGSSTAGLKEVVQQIGKGAQGFLNDVEDWVAKSKEEYQASQQLQRDIESAAKYGDKEAQKFLMKQMGANSVPGPAITKIANGHAFAKHVQGIGAAAGDNLFRGLGISTVAQFEAHIGKIVANPTAQRALSGGRTAFWDGKTKTVVIFNPKAVDAGTAFQPTNGMAYFNSLK